MAKSYASKPGPKPNRPLWPVLAMVAALALIVVGVVVLARPAAVQPDQGRGAAQSGPRVAVDQDKVDFGQVKLDTPVTAAFKVRNIGSESLQILGQPQVRVVEGC